MRIIKILIGSCGGLTGLYLSKIFRKSDWFIPIIYGFDTNEINPTKFFLNKFFKIADSSNEKKFISDLIYLIKKYGIDVYLPTHSRETVVVSKYKDTIESETGIKLLISPYSTYEILNDKLNVYTLFGKFGIDVPKIVDSESQLENIKQIFVKPRIGSGSKNTMIIDDIEVLKYLKRRYNNLIFVEFLEGNEYTVDAIFNFKGELLGFNQRMRIKTLGGAAIISQNDYTHDFEPVIRKISSKFKICGPANFQFICNGRRKVLTDINLRFASGGLPLTVRSGLNIPELVLKLSLGVEIKPEELEFPKNNIIMYRYFEEIFEER